MRFFLNGSQAVFSGDPTQTLLDYLRGQVHIHSVKNGCSGEGFCGACLVELDGKPALACRTAMGSLEGKHIITIEGFPQQLRETLAHAFVLKGAVQCGFCTPGFLMRTKLLLEKKNKPSRSEIIAAIKPHFCRCTGYHHIVDAIAYAADILAGREQGLPLPQSGGPGTSIPKYSAYDKALGTSPFVGDLNVPGMLYGVLRFSDHPRALIKKVDVSAAAAHTGVVRVITAADVPGKKKHGLIVSDWPLYVAEGEITHCTGDVLALVVALSPELARTAAAHITVEYEVLAPVTEMTEAENSGITVHQGRSNLLETCVVRRGGDAEALLAQSAYMVRGTFETQRIEHAFLETECALALPEQGRILLYTQSQGVYEDRKQLAQILNLPEENIVVTLVPNGGAFGGKEDMTVQPHAVLAAYLVQQPVQVSLSRAESMRMHPKRHPMRLEYSLGCDASGKLTALKARILGDTGAFASVGTKVLERAAGHATGAYQVPCVDIEAKTLYTNNPPSGAMRGFGVNQAAFAMESCIDMLCEKGGFDRWQFRFDNALTEGSMTATGQIVGKEAGVRECLLAVKDSFYKARYAGLACGIKNCGIGNGMVDFSEVLISIVPGPKVIIKHGWTEMGQGLFTVAQQFLCGETGIDAGLIEVVVSTADGAKSGMTTSSRGTSLIGNAIIEAAKALREDLKTHTLSQLAGSTYRGYWQYDKSTKPGAPGPVITHYSYSYAAQVAILDEKGEVAHIVAAHDAGKIINPLLFEGQIQGSVHMGLGYALSEELELNGGLLKSTKMRDLQIIPADKMPPVEVIGIEVPDPNGPHGAKGVGEIGLVPTAAAVANALAIYDGIRRYALPMKRRR